MRSAGLTSKSDEPVVYYITQGEDGMGINAAWKAEAMPLSASFDKPEFDFGAGNDRLFGVLARASSSG